MHLGLIFGCLYDACIKNACSKASGRRLGSPSQETNMPRCISGWKSVPLKLMFVELVLNFKCVFFPFQVENQFIQIDVLWN